MITNTPPRTIRHSDPIAPMTGNVTPEITLATYSNISAPMTGPMRDPAPPKTVIITKSPD